jgi:hypothetical protein
LCRREIPHAAAGSVGPRRPAAAIVTILKNMIVTVLKRFPKAGPRKGFPNLKACFV